MKQKILLFIIMILIMTVPKSNPSNRINNNVNKSLIIDTNNEMKEISSNLIDSNKIIYTNDKSIALAKGDTIHLELSLKENELKTLYSLTICIMKVDSELNRYGIISLITSMDDLNTYSDTLSYKTLNIEKKLTTSFDVESDGKYIVFVLDEEKAMDPAILDVNYTFTIGGENNKGDSSIILL